MRTSWGERLLWLGASIACLAVLAVASGLTPSAEGHGTHLQLGMPACGWAVQTGTPCPTCGMTTAVAHAARGNLGTAFLTQPMGAIGAVLAAATFWVGLHIALTGSRLGVVYSGMLRPRVVWIFAGVAAASWAYKWFTWTG